MFGLPTNYVLAGGVLLLLAVWQFWPAISSGFAWATSKKPPATADDPRSALDTALTLKLHFPAGSPGRLAMTPVIAEILKELEA